MPLVGLNVEVVVQHSPFLIADCSIHDRVVVKAFVSTVDVEHPQLQSIAIDSSLLLNDIGVNVIGLRTTHSIATGYSDTKKNLLFLFNSIAVILYSSYAWSLICFN